MFSLPQETKTEEFTGENFRSTMLKSELYSATLINGVGLEPSAGQRPVMS